MPDTVGYLKRACFAVCLAFAVPDFAAAQQPVVAPAPDTPEFLSRYDFHMNAAALANPDPRFMWDAQFGGTLDLVDYVSGRLTFHAEYETILGNEARAFDPNQSLYTLEGGGSVRVGKQTEIIGMFHHVSRHLSDRATNLAIAWNELGARVLHRAELNGTTVDLAAEGGWIVARALVDYTWAGEINVAVRRPVNEQAALFAHFKGKSFGANGDLPRTAQTGGFGEIGVRLTGRGAAMDLYVGLEKRIDAYPLDGLARHWVLAGFRLLSR